jgi:hypothetical protein
MAQDAYLTDQALLAQNPELQDLSRQRKLAEMLTSKAFEQPQGQMISGHYVKPSWTQQLAPLVSGIAGQAMGENLDKKQLAMAEALKTKGDAAVQKVMTDYKENPQLGLQTASALSQYPQVKALLPQLSKVAINEPTTDVQNFQYQQKVPEFGIYQREQANLKSPKTSVYNNMPPAESEYAKTFGAGVAKQDLALKDIAESAPAVISNVQRQKEILKSDKVITGFGAEPRLALAQFGQSIGAGGKNADELVANTQTLLAGRAGATLDAIKTSNLGSAQGFSNTDRDFLEKAKLGGIKYTAESLKRQLEIEEKVARGGLEKWNIRLKELPKSASAPINTNPVTMPPQNNIVDYNSLK